MAGKSGHKRLGDSLEAVIWRQASRQHGVVARSQLLHLGLSSGAIQHQLRRGHLHRLHCGVYAVGTPAIDQRGRWMAAVLACGRAALLSHRSAGELWEIVSSQAVAPEVSIPFADKHRPEGVVVHRRRVLTRHDRRARDRIPVTSPIRTLADLAAHLTDVELETAVNEAVMRDLVDLERLRERLDDVHGAGRLRRLLDRRVFRLTDSELERRFLRLVQSIRLPMPQTRTQVNGFRVDFFWPELGLIVETDGLRYHRTPAQQARDRRRDQVQTAAGLTTLRFTHAQIRFEAVEVKRLLVAVIDRLTQRRSAA
jgi:very-short-patch-repair endonuclease